MGGILSGSKDRWHWHFSGKEKSYQRFGTESSKIWNSEFYSLATNSTIKSYSNGQHFCPFLFGKIWRYSKQSSFNFKQGNLGLPLGHRNNDYCRVPRRSPQQRSGFSVTDSEGCMLRQWKLNQAGSMISHLLQVRSLQSTEGCIGNNLDQHEILCITPCLLIYWIFENGPSRSGDHNINHPSIGNSPMVFRDNCRCRNLCFYQDFPISY